MALGTAAVSASFWSLDANDIGPSGVRRTRKRGGSRLLKVPFWMASVAICHAPGCYAELWEFSFFSALNNLRKSDTAKKECEKGKSVKSVKD